MEMITEVIQRAEKLGILTDKRFNHMIDIDYANKVFNINFDKWINADDENFIHDFVGIYQNIDREKISKNHKADKSCFNFFVPRFAE